MAGMVDGRRMIAPHPLKLPDHRSVWPEILRPVNHDSHDKEAFDTWWQRNTVILSHLPPDLCQQWIYRHWTHSPFSFLQPETLTWERRFYDGQELLGSIYRAFGGDLHPQLDYETFQRKRGADRHQTAKALDSGTWDYPMILLFTPRGVIDVGNYLPDVRLLIVEGHQRHRYLNALHALGRAPFGSHEVLVLTTSCSDQS
jgi:hypothetical protein